MPSRDTAWPGQPPVRREADVTRSAHAARILVVDDEPANTALVSRLMKGSNGDTEA
jgi:hypothetical protein